MQIQRLIKSPIIPIFLALIPIFLVLILMMLWIYFGEFNFRPQFTLFELSITFLICLNVFIVCINYYIIQQIFTKIEKFEPEIIPQCPFEDIDSEKSAPGSACEKCPISKGCIVRREFEKNKKSS